MRRTPRNLITMLALAGALSGATVVPATAAPADTDVPALGETAPDVPLPAETTPAETMPLDGPVESDAISAESSAIAESEIQVADADARGDVKPDKNITVGQNRNEATGDVLGRGSEQLIRIENGKIVILENGRQGAAVLKTIDAGLNTEWPMERYGQGIPFPAFPGGSVLKGDVKHAPSRLAVLGDRIYVSRLLMRTGGVQLVLGWVRRDGILGEDGRATRRAPFCRSG